MQMLLHHREEGVTRERLEAFLFGDRDVENVHHALQSVVYNAKRRLRSFGLPEANYIVQKDGVFRWTDEIPVECDAAVFEDLARRAGEEPDGGRRLALYLTACGRYQGEFLPNQVAVVWAAQASRRCRSTFCQCVERAAALLEEREDYETMEQLGLYAARVDPLADWETVTMDSLVSRGMYQEARKLYDDTVQLYLQKLGLRPSRRLMEIFRRLGDRMRHRGKVLDDIHGELAEPAEAEGGYLCTYPVFRGIYRAVVRLMERGGQSVYLMLCALTDGGGVPLEKGEELEELTGRLEGAICRSLRRTDMVNHYGAGQFLVLLVNITLEDCRIVQQRIDGLFAPRDGRVQVRYYVNSVLSLDPAEAPAGWGKEQRL